MVEYSNIDDMPDLAVIPKNMCFTLSLRALNIEIGKLRSLNDPNGKKIFGLDDYALNKACFESKKLCDDEILDATKKNRLEDYIRNVLSGDIELNGKGLDGTNMYSSEYKLWWVFINPKVLCESAKFFGIWGGADPDSLSKKKIFRSSNDESRAKKQSIEFYENHELFSRGEKIAMNNAVGTPYEGRMPYKKWYHNEILQGISKLGETVFLGGKLTVYFNPLNDDDSVLSGCYVEVMCENYYGQRFIASGNPKYENFQPIGTVMETQANSTHSVYKQLEKIKGDDSSKILDLRLSNGGYMLVYLSQSAPLSVIKR